MRIIAFSYTAIPSTITTSNRISHHRFPGATTLMWQSYLNGLLVAFGLIMAIGTQNAYVLAQSLRREHHLSVALLCIVCDAVLVAGRGIRTGQCAGA
jgi:hypothetical protein